MSAIPVTSSNSNSFQNAARTTFRDSNGVPYVLSRISGTSFQVSRGIDRQYSTGSSFALYSGATWIGAGQSFTGTGGKISKINVNCARIGSPTGNVSCKIYAHTGTLGTSSLPTGSALATSETVDVSTLPLSYTDTDFTFSTPFQTSEGTNYVFTFEYSGGDSSNYFSVAGATTSYHYGNSSRQRSSDSVWEVSATPYPVDLKFYIVDTVNKFYNLSTYSSGTDISGVSGAIDSNDVIHISWEDNVGKASTLRYTTLNLATANPVLATPTTIVSDLGEAPASSANLYTAIAVDANNVPHIVYTEITKNVGYTAWYVNKVGGSWNTTVQVAYVSGYDTSYYDIAIDLDNLPIIIVGNSSGTTRASVFIGNLNNASSFTNGLDFANSAYTSVAVRNNGDVAFSLSSIVSYFGFTIRIHTYGDSWSTWTNYNLTGLTTAVHGASSLVFVGDVLYIFFEDGASNDIKYSKLDLSQGTPTWETPTVLETGTYNFVRAKWGFWADNDSIGALQLFISTITTNSANHFILNDTLDGCGQSFYSARACAIKNVQVRLGTNSSSPTGNLYLKIYAHSGTFGTSSIPTGTALATSEAFDVSTLPSDTSYPFYTISFATPFETDDDTYYVLVVEYTGGTSTNYVIVKHTGSNDYIDGNRSSYNGTTWTPTANYDLNIILFGKAISSTELDYAFVDETATPDVWWNSYHIPVNYSMTADYATFTLTGHWYSRQTQLKLGSTKGYHLDLPPGYGYDTPIAIKGTTSTTNFRRSSIKIYDVAYFDDLSVFSVTVYVGNVGSPSGVMGMDVRYGGSSITQSTYLGTSDDTYNESLGEGYYTFTFTNVNIPDSQVSVYFELTRTVTNESNYIYFGCIEYDATYNYGGLSLSNVTSSDSGSSNNTDAICNIILKTTVGNTLTAEYGSFSLTGQSVNWKISEAVTYASFSLTGNTVTFVKGKIFDAAPNQTFSLTGYDVTFTKALTLNASPNQSFTLTGYTATIGKSKIFDCSPNQSFTLTGYVVNWKLSYAVTHQSFTLTGYDVNFVLARNYTFDATPNQSFTLTGYNVVLNKGKILNATPQTDFTLTGYAVTLTVQSIFDATPNQTFVLTGYDVTLTADTTADYSIDATPNQSFTFTGYNIVLYAGRTLTAEYGTFSITGYNIAFIRNFYVEQASFTLTGYVANLYKALTINAAPNQTFSLTGYAVNLGKSFNINAAPNQTFSLTGYSITVIWTFTVDYGTLTLTGYDANLRYGYTLNATPNQSITVTAYEVLFTLQRNYTLSGTPQQTFTVSGNVVNLTGQYTINATPQQTFTVTGYSITFILGFNATPNQSYTLTGYATVITKVLTENASPNQSYTLTGYAVNFVYGHVLIAETGYFNFALTYADFQVYHASGGSGSEQGQAGTVDSVGGWTNLTVAALTTDGDANYAYTNQTSYTAGQVSNFGFTLGAANSVPGIAITFEYNASAANATAFFRCRFSIDGGSTWSNYCTEQSSNSTSNLITVGGAADTWGLSNLVGADFNSSTDFVVEVDGYITASNREIRLDYLMVEVYYSAAATQEYYLGGNLITYAVTGYDVSLNKGKSLNATNAQTFTVTGYDVTLTYTPSGQRTMTAEYVSFTLTGYATAFMIAKTYAVNVQTYTLTGYSILLVKGKVLKAYPNQTFTLTGYNTIFNIQRSYTANIQTFSVTGYDVILNKGKTIDATPNQSYTLTGYAVVLSKTLIINSTPNQVFTLTGYDVTLVVQGSYQLTVTVGYFSLTGYDVTLTPVAGNDYTITVDVGLFVLTGNSLNFQLSILIETGLFNTTGYDVAILFYYNYHATTQMFVVSGIDVAFVKALSVMISNGTFIVNGTDSNLYRSLLLTTEKVDYTVTGVDANITKQLAYQASLSEYSLTGYDVNLYASFLILAAEVGLFTLTGYDISATIRLVGEIIRGVSEMTMTATGVSEMTITATGASEMSPEISEQSKLF